MDKLSKKKNVVVIGGGTGTFVALSGLKKYPLHLSAIITMMDSGGSTGRLRDQLGVLPPGDLRQALVALSESDKLWRDLFLYRFTNGDLKGHNFGNIFISVLEKVTGSIEASVECASTILQTLGDVIPVTFTDANLCVKLKDGRIIKGETNIDEPSDLKDLPPITHAYLEPKASANKKAVQAIKNADLIVLGPGDLYTSIIPNLLVTGIKSALKKSKAKKLFVMNLMTKYGQTTNYTATEHLKDLEKFSGLIDLILLNTKMPMKKIFEKYEKARESVVEDDFDLRDQRIIRAKIIDDTHATKTKGDTLKRSVIRHNSDRMAKIIADIVLKSGKH